MTTWRRAKHFGRKVIRTRETDAGPRSVLECGHEVIPWKPGEPDRVGSGRICGECEKARITYGGRPL